MATSRANQNLLVSYRKQLSIELEQYRLNRTIKFNNAKISALLLGMKNLINRQQLLGKAKSSYVEIR